MIAFISKLKKLFIGDLLYSKWSTIKPIQIPPIPRIQKDLRRLIDTEIWKREDISSYISEISFYVCNRTNNNIEILEKAFLQFLVCRGAVNRSFELKMSDIKEMIEGLNLSVINVLGGNIFEYSEFDPLIEYLSDLNFKRRLFLVYLDFPSNESKLKKMRDAKIELQIAVTHPVRKERLEYVISQINDLGLEACFTFIVSSDQEMDISEEIASELKISKMILQPYYDGNNIDFFQKRVFLTKEDILDSKPTMREIIQKKEINPLSFGKLIVLADGSVYCNVNKPILGKIGINSVREMVLNELNLKDDWFITRHDMERCKECTFEYLCPPPSNYEYAIGRHDLCDISISEKK